MDEQPKVLEEAVLGAAEAARPAKKAVKKSRKSAKKLPLKAEGKRARVQRNFPASSFEEALDFARAIYELGSGSEVRRLTLFDTLKKSPESSASRMMVTNANKYNLINGNYASDLLSLTDDGRLVANPEANPKECARTKIKLAIEEIDLFNKLYSKYVGNKLPAKAALIDSAKEYGAEPKAAEEAIDTFIVNLRAVGLLQTLSGADRIVSKDHFLDTIENKANMSRPFVKTVNVEKTLAAETETPGDNTDFDKACFFIAPIGEENSEPRKHSDLVLGSLVEPALEQFKLSVFRADGIASPGMIGRQIMSYIIKARLVVVDLSFHNPNVFYELAIRHMLRKPIVQIIRKADRIPFDINHSRTIVIDTTDVYSLVPKIEAYRSQISTQVRLALENADSADNPVSLFYPSMTVNV